MIETTPADLRAALGVERWVTDLTAASPFDSLETLLATAHTAATPLSPQEIDEAISHHPRIGEKPVGQGAAQDFSRTEQGDEGDAKTNAAIARGNEAYERRFGRIFIIRAAGRSRAEILDELERRLNLPPEEEVSIVGEQLRDIALLRLEKLYAEEA
ncbi:2-oxo-4-hydroxy-4-carboxy-5-ureidoimidazoline decarboxylase [Pseudolysinimonas sp.]|jgi:2-oxo-4-hydroxy-4-carboxy-5-ureidoimidazoline decarboxylase|uniref:2-oxo-4-hydroxy-4-carboxy-5-ureidoimidazoline decarboxylase n=1 Tax=Pseudolysinimonas sp. TaxID=2680009 RepID=UPI003783BE23